MVKVPKKPVPLRLRSGTKTDVRAQVAALCYRYKNDKLQVCIVTTRNTGRWIIPRGWPTHKHTPADGAALEAYEEAGVRGTAYPDSIGAYSYDKPLAGGVAPVMVVVYAIAVSKTARDWPEKGQRKRKWLSPKKAAQKLADPGLQQIVGRFDPTTLDIARGA